MATAGSTSEEAGFSVHQQALVKSTLQSILDSPHFSKSKRYPAFLEYVVINTLEGNLGALKERVVGAEVFGRSPSYDPGTDPVVRIAAGEVRRRLAEYFSERPDAPMRIELPRGGYTAEFHFRVHPAVEALNPLTARQASVAPPPEIAILPESSPGSSVPFETPAPVTATLWWSRKSIIFIAVAITLILVSAVLATVWRGQHERGKRDFWWPVLHDANQPAVIVVGRHLDAAAAAAAAQAAGTGTDVPGRMNLLLDDVIVTGQTCNVFRMYGHDCTVLSAQTATEKDFHGKSVVLLGAFNNHWTPKITASLPFQVRNGYTSPELQGMRVVVEHGPTGDTPKWMVGTDQDRPGVKTGKDYAIIARFQSALTGGMAIWVAGLGPEGTSGAGKFLASPDQVAQLLSRAPKGWKGSELEAVLQVDFIQGQPDSIKLVDARFW